MNNNHQWMIWSIRIVLAIIFLFEILNFTGVLNFTLTFYWSFLALSTIITWLVIEILWRQLGRLDALDKGWLLFLITAFITVDFFGFLLRWYKTIVWYDQLSHFLGGIALAITMAILLRSTNILPDIIIKKYLSFNIQLLVLTALVSFFGILYEFAEYIDTSVYGHNSLGDVSDTLNDMFFNIVGGAVGGIIALKNLHQSLYGIFKKLLDFNNS